MLLLEVAEAGGDSEAVPVVMGVIFWVSLRVIVDMTYYCD